jgi:hypothetical protein
MDEHPPTILGKVFIFLATVAAGLLIVAGVVAALLSTCIEVGRPLLESGK